MDCLRFVKAFQQGRDDLRAAVKIRKERLKAAEASVLAAEAAKTLQAPAAQLGPAESETVTLRRELARVEDRLQAVESALQIATGVAAEDEVRRTTAQAVSPGGLPKARLREELACAEARLEEAELAQKAALEEEAHMGQTDKLERQDAQAQLEEQAEAPKESGEKHREQLAELESSKLALAELRARLEEAELAQKAALEDDAPRRGLQEALAQAEGTAAEAAQELASSKRELVDLRAPASQMMMSSSAAGGSPTAALRGSGSASSGIGADSSVEAPEEVPYPDSALSTSSAPADLFRDDSTEPSSPMQAAEPDMIKEVPQQSIQLDRLSAEVRSLQQQIDTERNVSNDLREQRQALQAQLRALERASEAAIRHLVRQQMTDGHSEPKYFLPRTSPPVNEPKIRDYTC